MNDDLNLQRFDVLVIGAGPAGLAAAHAAASGGKRVGVVDDNPVAGGQIWRGGPARQADPRARKLWAELQSAGNVHYMPQTRVLYAPEAGQLLVQVAAVAASPAEPAAGGGAQAVHGGGMLLHYDRLILATGARELLLPFPGWTLPGVTGAGGLQALAKGGYPVQGKRVVVAGSGPLLLAVAATLRERGATIAAIVEQAPLPQLAKFASGLLATPSKIGQALQLAGRLRGVPYWKNAFVRAAHPSAVNDGLHSVVVQLGSDPSHVGEIDCDYLACGYGLLPNLELAMALGCAVDKAVLVDASQQTSIPGIYCAGEGTGIGGVDLALAEGRIAGLAAAGLAAPAPALHAERARWRRFAQRLAAAFTLRPELRHLAAHDTIVCRCEDVCHGELHQHTSWRSAKLHTRCGMGPCQGRICGGATDVLYGWRPDAVRLPLSPARIGSILAATEQELM
jgi:NADPH-dependent 2,4-dienoyl-CoA reductase/sulfur reductase-like enzyme